MILRVGSLDLADGRTGKRLVITDIAMLDVVEDVDDGLTGARMHF